ncbi:MmcQ/YjbR family DNA-binding protein [Phenylobacterium sp.]|uniref:MmcQ/YjbR family DNA-binding protein n=1 Tax=Phenylobacterium sp. TaxID=1871053 RepID=UPI002BF78E00|nr:MmcQ/YjbR family DNA-binding protein [Phenylobacterium sp.]HVI31440.1 MmcQ/YjbR family DNA-binding protein [Phenylobacterium sp.]
MTRAEVEAVATALPGAAKVTLWDRLDVYKVRGRVFASCGERDGLTFRASQILYAVLIDDGPGRPAPGFVPGGWVNLPLAEADAADAAGWIENSHRLAAAGLTRKVRQELGLA